MHLPRRSLAAGALALAAITSATGCTATNAQQTAEPYAPGAAASVTVGAVHVASLFVASDGEGPAALVARIVNSGADDATVEISDVGGSGLSGTFDVEPSATVDVGPGEDESAQVASLDSLPGTVLQMTVSAGDEQTTLAVPVLDGTLEQYAQYVPTATPTGTPTPVVTSSPSASGTRSGSPTPSRSTASSTPSDDDSPSDDSTDG